ncbi:hypothetical protein A7982_13846 [Minicystis rosea]|nr:hypothetical protein A7982_13846 [Minicystis rosea]
MTIARPIDVRCARDRVVDFLGLGETTPLRDVNVQEVQLTVNVGAPCEITIDPAQGGVRYVLFDGDAPVAPVCSVDGTGEKVILKGPIIDRTDKTFRVHATKLPPFTRETFLLQGATVKVGLATDLPVSTPEIAAVPRLVDYGSHVTVSIADSQAGATYGLIDAAGNPIPMTPPGRVSGNKAGAITLTASRVTEDTVIRVDVQRTFDASEGRPSLHAVLTAELPIAVRANRALVVSAVGSPVVFRGNATITIAGSQPSALYSAYVRALSTVDFVADTGSTLVAIAVPGTAGVTVYTPRPPALWQATPGFVQHGDAKPGNGGVLELGVGPIQDDSIVVVQARKIHAAAEAPLASAVQVEQAAVILVRPEPAPPLVLKLAANADAARGTLLVSGGQPGVFYHFYRSNEATELGLPAYFHRLDEPDPSKNKGLAATEPEGSDHVPRRGLRVGMDLVITRDPPAPPALDPAHARPLDPLVDIAPLPVGGAVDVMAIKARTGIGWAAKQSVVITAVTDEPSAAPNTSTTAP